MLELPDLGTVPRTWTHPQPGVISARTALALIDCGAIPQSPLASRPADLVRLGLIGWLRGKTAGIRNFNFALHYGEFPAGAHNQSGFELVFGSMFNDGTDGRLPAIGSRVTALEKNIRGLGQAVLQAVSTNIAGVPLFAPPIALDMAMYHYWQGESDEKSHLAELRLNGENPDDYEIFTRAEFDKHIPRWASEPRKPLPRKNLESLALNHRRTGYPGKVARALCELHAARVKHENHVRLHGVAGDDDEAIAVIPALFLRWSARDPTPRIFDDWANEWHEAGELREHHSRIECSDDDGNRNAAILRAFLTGIEPLFPILAALDALVELVKGPHHGH